MGAAQINGSSLEVTQGNAGVHSEVIAAHFCIEHRGMFQSATTRHSLTSQRD